MVFFVFFKQKTAYEMRISDWSSDVCSSDLRSADAELHFPAFAGDLHIARIEIVAPGIIVSRLLAAELAGLLKFPCHRFVSFLSPPAPRRRLHATNRGRGCARAAAAIVPPGRDRKSTRLNSSH